CKGRDERLRASPLQRPLPSENANPPLPLPCLRAQRGARFTRRGQSREGRLDDERPRIGRRDALRSVFALNLHGGAPALRCAPGYRPTPRGGAPAAAPPHPHQLRLADIIDLLALTAP